MIRCMLQLFFSQSLGQECSVELLALVTDTIEIVLTITVLMITVLEPVRSYGSVILMMTILVLGSGMCVVEEGLLLPTDLLPFPRRPDLGSRKDISRIFSLTEIAFQFTFPAV